MFKLNQPTTHIPTTNFPQNNPLHNGYYNCCSPYTTMPPIYSYSQPAVYIPAGLEHHNYAHKYNCNCNYPHSANQKY